MFHTNGDMLTKTGETTDVNGLADVRLRLGNIPAEYTVTAKCEGCVPQFDTVNFTCCGKLPNDNFSQSGQSWSSDCYANHNCEVNLNATIGRYGCALTTLATLINYYANTYPELNISTTNPGALNIYLRNNNGYDARNNVNWVRIVALSNGHVRWIESADIDELTTYEDVVRKTDKEILAGRPIILKVRHRTSSGSYSTHFVLGMGKCGSNYIITDSGDSNREIFNPADPNFMLQGVRMFIAQ